MAKNELFQYSVMPALMDGVADRGRRVQRLLTHGDFGLGTFRHVTGEMFVDRAAFGRSGLMATSRP
ncbi:Alpha-acetolactate decarboxylase [Niveomyces insectorum RCEF 264]|uniref:Alpha-acetolactate decarboxylase n=1 Tax=Niveomyces insectorum RCEF 264 TaxID=1081102 RepID=A0A167P0Y7_9HYPO|nr:Alpha-acetolactate decarboxylase [Niveomyces insectorum RCEF 264]